MAECLTLDGCSAILPRCIGTAGWRARAWSRRERRPRRSINAPPQQLVWTSGATESNNLAILGSARAAARRGHHSGRHLVTARTEHKSVLDPCRRLEQEGFARSRYLDTDREGLIDPPQRLREALREDTVLVSIMHANNEIGVLQDIEAIAAICHERAVPLHVDAAQSAGKVALDVERLQCDLLSFTAHKLYGPKGVGALYFAPARRAALQPLMFGGGHERGLRSGTLAVHQIAGFGVACELAAAAWPPMPNTANGARATVAGPSSDRRGTAQRPCHAARARNPERVLYRYRGREPADGADRAVAVDRLGLQLRQR